MIIVPALLTDTKEKLHLMIKTCESFSTYVQVDVMDGIFVPSRSFPPKDLLSIKTSLTIEVHLMTTSPERYIEILAKAGVFKLIFHFEATNDPLIIIEKAKRKGLRVGMAINPSTTIQEVEDILDHIDSLLLLSVNPGFYGSEFIPDVLEKAIELKSKRPDYKIGMDGGIKLDNILRVKEAGVDMACVGSAIMEAENPKDAFKRFKELVEG